jgi:hypothetical protein
MARSNRFATFHNKRKEVARLVDIDGCFLRVSKNWIDPEDLVSPLIFIRAHSAFRAASEMAMAGQAAEAFTLQRSCIEYAAYCLHLNEDIERAKLWLNRHDSVSSKSAVRDEFSSRKLKETIALKAPEAIEAFSMIYESSIDFGAHPNERAITGNASIERKGKQTLFLQIMLHGEGLALDHALRSTAQAGVCALIILKGAFPDRYDASGVTRDLPRLREGL